MKYAFWILLILLIIFRYFTGKPVYKNGDRVRITSVIYSDPINYPGSQYIKISGLKIYLPGYPEVSYGDKIVVEGKVIKGELDKPIIISVDEGRGLGSSVRNKIIAFYQKVLPQPESGLIAGVVLGAKGAMSQDFYNQTKTTGVAHVVVASGTNVTFVVSFLIGVLTVILPRRKLIPLVILGIILYLFISGFEAPLIRAAIMSLFLFSGQETGRLVSVWRIFFVTGASMLIYRPEWITDIGFILSFVSTASLMLFGKRINSYLLKSLRLPRVFSEGLGTSLAAQIGVAPILFVTFGQFNIWSPLINAAVLWTVPFIMISGAVGGITGLVWPAMGKIILWLGYPFLWWFVSVVQFFG